MRALVAFLISASNATMYDLFPSSNVQSVIGALPRGSWIHVNDGATLRNPATSANSMRVNSRYPQAERLANPFLRTPFSSGRTETLASRKSGLKPWMYTPPASAAAYQL